MTFEYTFGKQHMGAGGQDMTQMMITKVLEPFWTATMNRNKNKNNNGECKIQLLDVGFGVGGTAMELCEWNPMAVSVHGIDVNPVGLEMAQQELQRRNQQRQTLGQPSLMATFELQDASTVDFEPQSLDIIYSRDTLLHLDGSTKQRLFAKFHHWLKPGGMVCIGDYCLGRNSAATGQPTTAFAEYLDARGYHMWTPSDYAKAFETAGFQNAQAEDLAFWYCTMCQKELDRVLLHPDVFLRDHPKDTLTNLTKTYQDKIGMTLRGDRSYVLVTAVKKANSATSILDHHNSDSHIELRQRIVDVYTKLSREGYVLSCDGNVSVRVDANHLLLTPSGVAISDLDASSIVLCDRNGTALPGQRYKPTSEKDLHTLIYQTRPDVHAIVHSHSIYACALACCRQSLPASHYAVCELLENACGGIPSQSHQMAVQCAPYFTYGTWPLAVATVSSLGKNHAVFMANHGAVVVGSDLDTAMYLTSRLERECEIYWRCQQLGIPQSLTGREIHDLARRDLTYGQQPQVVDKEESEDGRTNEKQATTLSTVGTNISTTAAATTAAVSGSGSGIPKKDAKHGNEESVEEEHGNDNDNDDDDDDDESGEEDHHVDIEKKAE